MGYAFFSRKQVFMIDSTPLVTSRGGDPRSFTEVVSDVVDKIIEIAKTIFYVLAAPFIYAYECIASLFESEEETREEDTPSLGETLQPPSLRRISSGDIDLSHCNFDSILSLNKEGYRHIVATLELAKEQREIWGDSPEDYIPDINSTDPKIRKEVEDREDIIHRMSKQGLELLIARPSTWALVYSLALDEKVFPLLHEFLKQKVQRENFLNGAMVTQKELAFYKIAYLFTRLTAAGGGLRAKCMKKVVINEKLESVFAFPGLNQGMTEGLPKDSEERIKFVEYICRAIREKKPDLFLKLHYNSPIVQEGVRKNDWRPFLGLVFDVPDLYANLQIKQELEDSTNSLTDNLSTPIYNNEDGGSMTSSGSSSSLSSANGSGDENPRTLFEKGLHKVSKRMNKFGNLVGEVSDKFGSFLKEKSSRKVDPLKTDS